MGNLVLQTACPECSSSDGFSVYEQEDGTHNATCFVCEHYEPEVDIEGIVLEPEIKSKKGLKSLTVDDVNSFQTRGVKERKLTKESCEFFGMKVGTSETDPNTITHHYYPFHKDGKLVGYQERTTASKKFMAVGYGKQDIELVGQHLFPAGGRTLTITEGVLDAIAVHQAMVTKYGDKGKGYAVVSLPNGANAKTLKHNWEYVSNFDKVVLMFDNDEPGIKNAESVAKALPANKAAIARLPLKDPADMVKAGRGDELINAFFNAKTYTPAGIIASSDTWNILEEAKNTVSVPYAPCMAGVTSKIYGRRLGEIVLLTGGTGSGKTQFIREDIYDLLQTTDDMIGVCSLEEGLSDSIIGLMSIEANKRLHLPDTEYTDEEYKEAWQQTMGSDRIMFLDHQGSVSDDSLLAKIGFMIASGCKYIYLDHITIAVSEAEGSKNEAMDRTMSDLLKLTKRHNVWLGVVSHLRKTSTDGKSFEEGAVPTSDDLKGSGSLKQIAFDIIAFARNQYAKTDIIRNTVSVHILKSRFTGNTGFAGKARFDGTTGRLNYLSDDTKELSDETNELENEEEFVM